MVRSNQSLFSSTRYKVFFLIASMVVCALEANPDYYIVFVHLGNALPEYLYDALEQVRQFNDERAAVWLLADQVALDKADHAFFKKYQVDTIGTNNLVESKIHKEFKRISQHDQQFRDGFWRKCTERFFYLDELLQQYKLQNVFHLESDNMLYVNLHELLAVFQTYTHIGATFERKDRCIPGFMYFAKPDSLKKMVKYICPLSVKGWHDMATIGAYYSSHSPFYIDQLPTIIPRYIEKLGLRCMPPYKPKRPRDRKYVRYLKRLERLKRLFCNKIDQFNSIFDAAAYGSYLGGQDPRNGPCEPGHVIGTCLFDSSRMGYEWHIDEEGRNIPYATFDGTRYRINNLHIHSKDLKKFASR